MQHFSSKLAAIVLAIAMLTSSIALAAKTYQVTGTVTKLTDKIITVTKANDEVWEIDRDTDTKITGELKVGAKVTIEYTMTAKKVEVK
jgi:hypothetical protein